MVVAQLNATR